MNRTRVIASVTGMLAASLFAGKSPGVTNTYTFDPNQSTVVEAFLFSKTYTVRGTFQLTVDGNVATLDSVDATLSEEPESFPRDLGELFYTSELVGTVVNDTTIEFELPQGHPLRQSYDLHITLTYQDEHVSLAGLRLPLMIGEPGFTLEAAADACPAKIIYVDNDAPGANDGTSWIDAYNCLQDALRVAESGDRILVAEGVYKPDEGIYQPPGERTATFQLISGVTIHGGYAGYGGADPNARDIELHETILSGDLQGNDTDSDSSGSGEFFDLTHDPNRAENSYSVVTASGTDGAAVLDGFTITGGNANGPILGRCPDMDYRLTAGAGIYNVSGSPTVLNCTFLRNTTRSPYGCSGDGCPPEADAQALTTSGGFYCSCTCWRMGTGGAGMFNCKGNPTLHNCRFIENVAFGADTYSLGAAIFNGDGRATLVGCTFVRNVAEGFDSEYYGGAVFDCNSTTTYLDCSFVGNSSHAGGALYADNGSTATLTRCVLAGNRSEHGGGAIHCLASRLNLANCTLAGNRASYGSAIDCDMELRPSRLEVVNSILWNGGNEVTSNSSEVEIAFSDIQGGWEGRGNISSDPCFAHKGYWDNSGTPDTEHDDFWVDGDYHLKSQAGRWDANDGRWVMDEVTSLCIDGGDPMSPIGYEPFPNGGIINMGAYGGTAEASKSYFGEPPCDTIVAGDINGDCEIDFKDFAIMALHWLEDYQP